jgi:hypothetical protein
MRGSVEGEGQFGARDRIIERHTQCGSDSLPAGWVAGIPDCCDTHIAVAIRVAGGEPRPCSNCGFGEGVELLVQYEVRASWFSRWLMRGLRWPVRLLCLVVASAVDGVKASRHGGVSGVVIRYAAGRPAG